MKDSLAIIYFFLKQDLCTHSG